MNGLLSIVVLGFFLGVRHTTDPDHVIAVATIVARNRTVKHAALIGSLWGLGHALTVAAVGGGIILLGTVIPTRIGLSMEFSVGLMLILLGTLNLQGILQWVQGKLPAVSRPLGELHPHRHRHSDHIHSHPRQPETEDQPHNPDQAPPSWLDRHFAGIGFYQIVRPFVVGIVHGLAGSTAVALLILTTIPVSRWAFAYLIVFGVGTIAGMTLITAVIGLPLAFNRSRLSHLNWAFRLGSGLVSLVFGLFLTYQTGFVKGLFTGHLHWKPH